MEKRCILLIDIGNTNTKIGLAIGDEIVSTYVLPTTLDETSDTFGFKILALCRHVSISIHQIKLWMVSSVVPPLNGIIKEAGEKYSKCPVIFVPEDLPLPLENKYANPSEVGSDRLVTAYAARNLFSSPGLIVIDFGTATTLECVQDNVYLGGLICPGILSSLQALSQKTAKLPKISLDVGNGKMQIGDSTITSMTHGFIFGFASMVDGLCERLKEFLTGEIIVVATGGFAPKIKPVCKSIHEIRPDLLLKGLLMASNNFKKFYSH